MKKNKIKANSSITKNLIFIVICLILLFGCGLLYKSFIKIGEDNIQFSCNTWSKCIEYKYDSTEYRWIGYGNDTIDNDYYGKNAIIKYALTNKRSIYIPFNYGGTHTSFDTTLGMNIRETFCKTFISDTLVDKDTILPNKCKKINNKYLDSVTSHHNISRIDEENVFSRCTVKVSNSFIKPFTNDPIIDTLSKTTFDLHSNYEYMATIIRHNDTDWVPVAEQYLSYNLHVPRNKTYRTTAQNKFEIFIPAIGKKPNFFRKEDLSKRILNINLVSVMDIDTLYLDFNGPFNAVAADLFPDSTTMTTMLFFKPSTTQKLWWKRPIRLYVEFPKQEHVQEARILIITTFALSVLCTLIINCLFAIFKYANRDKKTNEMKKKSIPCYGSFSDCSECIMYDSCSYRPIDKAYSRTNRRTRSSLQKRTLYKK